MAGCGYLRGVAGPAAVVLSSLQLWAHVCSFVRFIYFIVCACPPSSFLCLCALSLLLLSVQFLFGACCPYASLGGLYLCSCCCFSWCHAKFSGPGDCCARLAILHCLCVAFQLFVWAVVWYVLLLVFCWLLLFLLLAVVVCLGLLLCHVQLFACFVAVCFVSLLQCGCVATRTCVFALLFTMPFAAVLLFCFLLCFAVLFALPGFAALCFAPLWAAFLPGWPVGLPSRDGWMTGWTQGSVA